MLTKIVFRAIVLYALIAFSMMFGGGFLYLVTIAIATAIMLIFRYNHKKSLKITRWASTNAVKARILITVLQLLLVITGLLMGFNLGRSGIELPGSSAIIFSLIIIAGFLSVPFLPARNMIAIPHRVNRNRLAFLGIAISFFMMMVITGNKMESKYPGAIITQELNNWDEMFFPADPEETVVTKVDNRVNKNELLAASSMTAIAALSNFNSGSVSPVIDPEKDAKAKLKADKKAKKLEKKKARQMERMKKRMGLTAALGAGAVILIILLVLTTCAGVCLIIAGLSDTAALIPLGILVAGGSIYGIIQIAKKNRRPGIAP